MPRADQKRKITVIIEQLFILPEQAASQNQAGNGIVGSVLFSHTRKKEYRERERYNFILEWEEQ